ncbi:MAG TPA: hypothetical protein DEA47_02390 [Peptococcaceae bacterium]|nr:MAG: Uncharacterized protein XD50_0081 [Clostridia bacterium 41_269]HBT20209.1 hypothetical protein [Peptococcaceae bacterium]
MPKAVRKLISEEKGSAVVVLALAMVALIGFAALVIDVGLLFAERTKMLAAADASAMAGVQDIFSSEQKAEVSAEEYIEKNGFASSYFEINADAEERTVAVKGKKLVSLFFARIFDEEAAFVSAEAKARAEGLVKASGVVPLGIEEQPLVKGQLYTLKIAAPPTVRGGTFGALSLGGTGADRYRENLKYGYDKPISVGDIIDTETGNMANPTRTAVEYRMQSCNHVPQCTHEHYERGCPRIVIVPVYEPYLIEGQQLKKVVVKGFAAFLLDGQTKVGTDCYIRGYFIDYVFKGETDDTQGDYGAYGVKLIQ